MWDDIKEYSYGIEVETVIYVLYKHCFIWLTHQLHPDITELISGLLEYTENFNTLYNITHVYVYYEPENWCRTSQNSKPP